MQETYTLKDKWKLFFIIFLPIVITQVGMFSMNFFDTMMSGRVSADDLAGVAIGSSIWLPIFTGVGGILMAITPIVAQLNGAQKKGAIANTVHQAIYLSLIISLGIILLMYFFIDAILSTMSLTNEVYRIAKEYLLALLYGIVPMFIYMVLRSFMDALGQTRISMLIMLTSVPINLFFNYVLIFGKWGFPALGGVGAGYATSITYWSLALLACLITAGKREPFYSFRIYRSLPWPQLSTWKEIMQIGVPMGFTILAETLIFAVVTLLMSTYDTTTIAAHQAALNFSTLIYMIPLSISMSMTITVGFEVGAKRFNHAQLYIRMGLLSAIGFAVINGLILFFFRENIAGWYTTDPEVLSLAIQFLIYALFFLFSDAVNASIQGVLRGYKDVNYPFIVTLISFWVIGLPVGFLLSKYTTLGPFGYWIGLIIGLALGALGLSYRLFNLQKRISGQVTASKN